MKKKQEQTSTICTRIIHSKRNKKCQAAPVNDQWWKRWLHKFKCIWSLNFCFEISAYICKFQKTQLKKEKETAQKNTLHFINRTNPLKIADTALEDYFQSPPIICVPFWTVNLPLFPFTLNAPAHGFAPPMEPLIYPHISDILISNHIFFLTSLRRPAWLKDSKVAGNISFLQSSLLNFFFFFFFGVCAVFSKAGQNYVSSLMFCWCKASDHLESSTGK